MKAMKEMVYTANQFGEEFSLEQYKEFMYCKDNEGNCRHCPENTGMQGSNYPCGQQNCWVSCHCN